MSGFADTSAKVQKNIDILGKFRVKYILSVAVLMLFVQFVVGTAPLGHAAKASTSTDFAIQDTTQRRQRVRNQSEQPLAKAKQDSTITINPDSILVAMTDSLAARQRTSGQGTGLGQVISGRLLTRSTTTCATTQCISTKRAR